MKRFAVVLFLILAASLASAQGYIQTTKHMLSLAVDSCGTSYAAGKNFTVHGTGLTVIFTVVGDSSIAGHLYVAVNGDSTNKIDVLLSTSGPERFTTPIQMPNVRSLRIWSTIPGLRTRGWLY